MNMLTLLDTSQPVRSHAVISGDGLYRYSLLREWDQFAGTLTFVMLNPSTADAQLDDPTIRRCIGFAKREGFGKLVVLNLYALRATDPKALSLSSDPVGPDNDTFLGAHFSLRSELDQPVVAAWGVNAKPERVACAIERMRGVSFQCLGTTKDGHPRHPLYVRSDQQLVPWKAMAS
jgi:hypothetical protein